MKKNASLLMPCLLAAAWPVHARRQRAEQALPLLRHLVELGDDLG